MGTSELKRSWCVAPHSNICNCLDIRRCIFIVLELSVVPFNKQLLPLITAPALDESPLHQRQLANAALCVL
eukprot:20667-Heterococcus_DN1.PRE.4